MARTTQESSKATTTKRKSTTTASSPKKTATKSNTKTTAKKPTAKATGRRPKAKLVQVTSEQRHALIAEAAYLRAERCGFNNDPAEDWLIAEQEVDARLSEHAIAS